MTFLLFSILMHSKKTSAFLVSNNLTLRLKGICVILFLFLINWLGWGHLSILIIKKRFKKRMTRVAQASTHQSLRSLQTACATDFSGQKGHYGVALTLSPRLLPE